MKSDRIVFNFIGKVLITFALLFIFPIIVCMVYKESILPFLIPQLISLIIGILLNRIKYGKDNIYAKQGFKIVSFSWILISLIGALPLIINKDAGIIDSIFETVSGFTTTGATIFSDVECLNKSILFWRSFSHFMGGMGVIAFVMSVIPLSQQDKSMHILKAEMPGPTVGKLFPGIKKTLKYLYFIYLGLTLTEMILLLFGGMSVFDSLLISIGTAGTGGFSILNNSLASYSMFTKCVVGIFMFLFGINFNIYFLILMGDIKNALKSEELKVYISIFVISILFVFSQTYGSFLSIKQALVEAFFHISSIMSSTGYSIGNINIYPTSCRMLILVLMLVSACAGSTCGGVKMSRLIIVFKVLKRDLIKVVHPNSVHTITFEGKKVMEETIKSTTSFLGLYIALICVSIFIVSFDGFSFESTVNAVFSTFGNVGLCFDVSNYAGFSNLSKITLSIGMLLGRLEIFPIISLFTKLRKD